MIIKAVILCLEKRTRTSITGGEAQRSCKPASDDDDDNVKKVLQGNFLAIINTFTKCDTILKEHREI